MSTTQEWIDELKTMVARLPAMAEGARAGWRDEEAELPDYMALVRRHNARRRR